jgi:hypothetical protein
MHDMAIMMQCNLSKLSGIGILTHIYMVQVILLLGNLNVDYHINMAWVSYAKLNGTGTRYITIPHIFHM